LIASNGGSDKAIAKKDLFVSWGISVKYLISSPEQAKFEDFVKSIFSKSRCLPDKLFMLIKLLSGFFGFDGLDFIGLQLLLRI